MTLLPPAASLGLMNGVYSPLHFSAFLTFERGNGVDPTSLLTLKGQGMRAPLILLGKESDFALVFLFVLALATESFTSLRSGSTSSSTFYINVGIKVVLPFIEARPPMDLTELPAPSLSLSRCCSTY